jgi:hypothetical protein
MALKCLIVYISYLVGLLAASGEDRVLGSETNSFLQDRNAVLEEEKTLSEVGILGANNTKIFGSDSDLYLSR